jgi:3-methyladenine DNA glycosylase/8-oxoguanine DNA glycosylase
MFMMFGVGHPDVFSAGDLGLVRAMETDLFPAEEFNIARKAHQDGRKVGSASHLRFPTPLAHQR